jgi:hypothetical protein
MPQKEVEIKTRALEHPSQPASQLKNLEVLINARPRRQYVGSFNLLRQTQNFDLSITI